MSLLALCIVAYLAIIHICALVVGVENAMRPVVFIQNQQGTERYHTAPARLAVLNITSKTVYGTQSNQMRPCRLQQTLEFLDVPTLSTSKIRSSRLGHSPSERFGGFRLQSPLSTRWRHQLLQCSLFMSMGRAGAHAQRIAGVSLLK